MLARLRFSLPHVNGLPPSGGVLGTTSGSPPNSESVATVEAELNEDDGVSGGVRSATDGRRGEPLRVRGEAAKVSRRVGEFCADAEDGEGKGWRNLGEKAPGVEGRPTAKSRGPRRGRVPDWVS